MRPCGAGGAGCRGGVQAHRRSSRDVHVLAVGGVVACAVRVAGGGVCRVRCFPASRGRGGHARRVRAGNRRDHVGLADGPRVSAPAWRRQDAARIRDDRPRRSWAGNPAVRQGNDDAVGQAAAGYSPGGLSHRPVPARGRPVAVAAGHVLSVGRFGPQGDAPDAARPRQPGYRVAAHDGHYAAHYQLHTGGLRRAGTDTAADGPVRTDARPTNADGEDRAQAGGHASRPAANIPL